jgi:hypothetical protein
MTQLDAIRLSQPLLNWTARQIHDPVGRLRYLRSVAPSACKSRWKSRKTIGFIGLLAFGLILAPLSLRMLGAANAAVPAPIPRVAPPPVPLQLLEQEAPAVPEVWRVETGSDFEIYSNGLRIENQYAVTHRKRAYRAFSREYQEGSGGERRTEPVGIVYHTTESLQAPFEPGQNNVLKRVGESLLEYVRRRRCYNFLIDRFGRVFRIVHESDAADHAGHSVWADAQYFYINLNDSFLGISLEAQTGDGETITKTTSAQVRAGAMLTEMLRSRYKIAGRNCVTHAQVSVNPFNLRIGYHVDWASTFPFEGLGLPDNYAMPSPAISLFGFGFDASFEQRAGTRLAAGALAAERGLREAAQAAHLSLAAYRKALQRRYLHTTTRGQS